MLVLSRERDETIRLTLEDGRTIDFTVVDIRGEKVRLGVTADRSIVVSRPVTGPASAKAVKGGD